MKFCRIKRSFFPIILAILSGLPQSTRGMVPIESLLLGDLSETYVESRNDPLSSLLRDQLNYRQGEQSRYQLGVYSGVLSEGENLSQMCKLNKEKIYYSNTWDEEQVKRSMAATLRYIGLDTTVRALSKFAKEFEYDKEEYDNLVNSLVGNYCSKNISVISLRQLKKYMSTVFDKGTDYVLPNISDNEFFAPELLEIDTPENSKSREFGISVELFKAFCSWDGSTEDYKLLVPLLRNPVIMAMAIRHMRGETVTWDNLSKKNQIAVDQNSEPVLCQNLICRKRPLKLFNRLLPRAVGSINIKNDLERLYCKEFRNADYNYKTPDPKLKKIIDRYAFDDQNILIAQFIALQTGVPDFLVRAEKFSDLQAISGMSFNHYYNTWAKSILKRHKSYLYYEEPLTVELVDRDFHFDVKKRNFKLFFEVNLGEFDRTNQVSGRLKTVLKLNFSKKMVNYFIRSWNSFDPSQSIERTAIVKHMESYLRPQLTKARENLLSLVWNDELNRMIIKELFDQFSQYGLQPFDNDKGSLEIPVYFTYGPFALKYIRYKHQVDKEINYAKIREESFKRRASKL